MDFTIIAKISTIYESYRYFDIIAPVAQPRFNRGQRIESMKPSMYILKSLSNRYYIGSTNNLVRRVKEHIKGKTRTTKILKTRELVYLEEFDTIEEARAREKKLKTYKSKKYIEWLISKSAPVAQRIEQITSND